MNEKVSSFDKCFHTRRFTTLGDRANAFAAIAVNAMPPAKYEYVANRRSRTNVGYIDASSDACIENVRKNEHTRTRGKWKNKFQGKKKPREIDKYKT